jgi:kinesin family protein 5
MFGDNIFNQDLKGIIPRTAKFIFDQIRNEELDIEYQVSCSMIEIYMESVRDLLGDTYNLKIKESKKKGIYIEGLLSVPVVSEEEMYDLFNLGNEAKVIAETQNNKNSSRSHTIFMLELI